jgi:hypothetical protein
LYENAYLSVEALFLPGIVRVVRNDRPIETIEEIEAAFGALNQALARLDHAHHCLLLLDFRRARGRNDDDFERAVAPYRARTVQGFRKVAVLVRSAPGRLQVQRHARTNEVAAQVFMDEQVALAWLGA